MRAVERCEEDSHSRHDGHLPIWPLRVSRTIFSRASPTLASPLGLAFIETRRLYTCIRSAPKDRSRAPKRRGYPRGYNKRHFQVRLVHEPPFHVVLSNDNRSLLHHEIDHQQSFSTFNKLPYTGSRECGSASLQARTTAIPTSLNEKLAAHCGAAVMLRQARFIPSDQLMSSKTATDTGARKGSIIAK